MTTNKNEEIHTENKRFLQTLQEKIFNMGSGYEIDDENQNPPDISPKKEILTTKYNSFFKIVQ